MQEKLTRLFFQLINWLALFIPAAIIANGVCVWRTWGTTNAGCYICMVFLLVVLLRIIFTLLLRYNLVKRALYGKIFLALLSLGAGLIVAEFILRSPLCNKLGLQTYAERNGSNIYASPFRLYLWKCEHCGDNYFYVRRPLTRQNDTRKEYHYAWTSNSYGLRDTEFDEAKPANEFRILGLGDSFTEGVGAPADSTWLKQLEHKLNQQGSVQYATLNGGSAGSDLFFSYSLLKDCLYQFKPDLVILDLNSTDIGDVLYRGGDERFNKDGKYVGRKSPWWEFLFGSSYLVRLIALNGFGLSWEFFPESQREERVANALNKISMKINNFQSLSRQMNFAFLLVIQPMMDEALGNENRLMRMKIDPGIKTIETLDYMHNKAPQDSIASCYWPIDQHFNAKGYSLMADCIYDSYFNKRLAADTSR